MNKNDGLFRTQNDLLAANKEISLLKQEKASLSRQVLELREIIAKLTKAPPNTQR